MNTKNNKGCIYGIIGTLAVMIGVVIYAILSSLISRLITAARFANSAVCTQFPFSMLSIGIVFVLFEIIFILGQIKAGKKGSDEEQKINKIFKLTVIICLSLTALFSIINANTFTKLSENSISKVFFLEYKSYDIENDIARYKLVCDANGQIAYTVTMNDGEKIDIFSSVNSCTDEFIEKYDNLYGYAAHITDVLSDAGYPSNIKGAEYMEKYYKDINPNAWIHLEKMILRGEENG